MKVLARFLPSFGVINPALKSTYVLLAAIFYGSYFGQQTHM
jgi:hypothetical protein